MSVIEAKAAIRSTLLYLRVSNAKTNKVAEKPDNHDDISGCAHHRGSVRNNCSSSSEEIKSNVECAVPSASYYMFGNWRHGIAEYHCFS